MSASIYNRMDKLWYSFTKEHYIAMKVSKLLHKHKLSKKARHKILTVDSIYKKFYNYKPN